MVADGGEHPEALRPVDIAAAGRHEVPPTAGVGPGQVRPEDAAAAVRRPHLGVLAVDVVDPVAEVPDEVHRVDALPHHVRGVPVEAERGPVVDRLEGARRGVVVVGDLGRVDLVREPDADLVEHVENRVPPRGEVEVAASTMAAEAGGNIATYFQIDDPVNPTTVDTPSRAAVRAAFLTASAAR